VRAQIRDQATDHRAILILPIDLPRADKGALSLFIHRKGDVVIAPDQRLSSSSAATRRFEFGFGPRSFVQHQQVARTAAFTVAVHKDSRLAFDVDSPADYREWRRGDETSQLCSIQAE
jgi:2-phospho-L-lactate guanylyltransferase (CobY/MobA/RfbA family)